MSCVFLGRMVNLIYEGEREDGGGNGATYMVLIPKELIVEPIEI